MSDIISLIINTKDYASGGIQKVGVTARNVFGGIEGLVTKTQKSLNDLGKPVKVRVDTGDIEHAAREVDNLGEKMKGISSWGIAKGAFWGGMAKEGVMMAGRAALDVGRSALEMGMRTEREIVGLSTFVGDARAKSIYSDLQQQAVHTPYTTSQLMPIEFGLVATGMTPEKANKDMMALANAVASTGGSDFMLELMGSHMAQAASAGKIDGMLLREFQRTAHIPVKTLLAKDMYGNLPLQQGLKKVEALDSITYDQFTHALQRASQAGGMFAGGMEKLSQTMSGKWSTIKDFWGIFESKMTMSQRDNIIGIENRIISGLQDLPGVIEKMTPVVGRLFDEFNYLWPSVRGFGKGIMGLLQPVGEYLMSDSFKDLTKSVLNVAGTLTDTLKPVMVTFGEELTAASNSIKPFTDLLDRGLNKLNNLPGMGDSNNHYSPKNWFDYAQIAGVGGPAMYLLRKYVTSPSPGGNWGTGIGANGLIQQPNIDGIMDDARRAAGLKAGYAALNQVHANYVNGKIKDAGAKGALAETNDAIIGGGRKSIQISFKNFVETLNNNVNGKGEGQQWTENELKGMLYRIAQGIPS